MCVFIGFIKRIEIFTEGAQNFKIRKLKCFDKKLDTLILGIVICLKKAA